MNTSSKFNNFVDAIIAASASLIQSGVDIASMITNKKGTQAAQIEQYLYDAVYLEGMSLEDVIELYPQLYKKNKKLFEQVYNAMSVKRNTNSGSMDMQTLAIGGVILIVVILIIRNI